MRTTGKCSSAPAAAFATVSVSPAARRSGTSTAHAAGAAAVLVPDRRAAGLTETVAKAAAGALEHLPVVRIGNVSQTLETLKGRGFWIYGVDERAKDLYS